MKFVHIGFENYVSVTRIVSVTAPDSAPMKRMIQDAKDHHCIIDATCGKRTQSIIVTDSKHIILSSLSCDEIIAGCNP